MGCDVHVAPGGVPVTASRLLFVTYDAAGNPTTYEANAPGRKPLCGLSTWNEARTDVEAIRIALDDRACTGEYAAAHEMGHALVRARGHTLTGVLAGGHDVGKSDRIDDASLTAVCSMRPCGAFEPER